MNEEEPDAMRELDTRLSALFGTLDTRPGFEQRVAMRIAQLEAERNRPVPADAEARLAAEHERAQRAADRAARMDGLAAALAGLGGLAGLWRFAPEITQWYAVTVEPAGPLVIAFGSMAVFAVATMAVLGRFGLKPRSLVGA